jgi:DNA-directed RNA polymerase subunit RPC12/RpoP
MNILQRAERFVESLIRPGDPRQCAHCGYRLTKKHGSYRRQVRLLGGAKEVPVQRYWCHRCQRSYSDRRVKRMVEADDPMFSAV